MRTRPHRCDPSRLQHLLGDDLSEEESARVIDHLDQCGPCREALDGLVADRGWWDELIQRFRGEPETAGLAGLSKPADETAAIPGLETPPEEDRPDLSFLAPAEEPGQLGRIGQFGVTGVLGQGGMGIVLKAVDTSLNRVVAIKVLARHLAASGAARRRFAREARAAAAVVHDHVVAIHVVESHEGLPYLIMPYIAGGSLQERIDRDGPLSTEQILRIGMQVALGLSAAHDQGLVHRDIKPSNILLENGVERVKLVDFGLARAADDASLTQSGVVAGTPQYMSPEQALGDAIDHRSDLFSLGSVLYAMATGHPPFRASNTMAVLRRVIEDRPRPVREVNPEVPPALARVIDRLMEKAPDRRYRTAAEVAEVLGSLLADIQRPGSVPARRRTRVRRIAAGLLGVAALGALALGISLVPAAGRSAPPGPGRPEVLHERPRIEWQEPDGPAPPGRVRRVDPPPAVGSAAPVPKGQAPIAARPAADGPIAAPPTGGTTVDGPGVAPAAVGAAVDGPRVAPPVGGPAVDGPGVAPPVGGPAVDGPAVAPAAGAADRPVADVRRGKVLGPAGEPIRDARVDVFFAEHQWSNQLVGEPTGEPGGFFFPDEIGSARAVAATARGFGFGWAGPREIIEANPVPIRLAAERTIRGRILGQDGKPVEGARVRVLEARNLPPGGPKALRQADPNALAVEDRQGVWSGAIPGQPAEVRTGPDGRFDLEGAGRGRAVRLAIEGPGGQHSDVTVCTVDPAEVAAVPPGAPPIYGADFEHRLAGPPASPSKP